MTKEEKYAKEEEFLNVLAKAYETYEVGTVPDFLSEDLSYSSFWVLDELKSKEAYMAYLAPKLQTLKNYGNVLHFFTMYVQGEGKPFLMITKKQRGDYAGFICDCNDDGKISKLSIMPTGFYRLCYKDKEAFEKAINEEY